MFIDTVTVVIMITVTSTPLVVRQEVHPVCKKLRISSLSKSFHGSPLGDSVVTRSDPQENSMDKERKNSTGIVVVIMLMVDDVRPNSKIIL